MDVESGARALFRMSGELSCGLLSCGIAVSFAATFLYFGYLELSKFTGGKLVRLDDVDESLADRLEAWMPLPEMWHVASRTSHLLAWGASAIVFGLVIAGFQECLARWLSGLGVLLFYLLLLTLADMIAPRLSLRSTARLLCFYIPLFRLLSRVMFPFAWLSALSSRDVAAKAAEEGSETENISTAEDEILSLVKQAESQGTTASGLEEDERRMISGALELDEKRVHEIMTQRVDIKSVDASESIEGVKQLIVTSGHSRIPVCCGTLDKVVGVIYAKDLLDEEKVRGAEKRGLEALWHEAQVVSEFMNIGALLEQFQSSKTHFAVVIDEYGGTSGIVTFEDILEELVGEIWDEYDKPAEKEPEPQADADGWFVFSARTPIDKVNETLDIELPEDEDVDTLGGYLLKKAGRIPAEHETLDLPEERLQVVIEAAEPQCVKTVRLKVIRPEGEAETREPVADA